MQVRVAPPAEVMLRVTEALLEVTVFPAASWTVTTGWVPKSAPPVELEGFVVKTSLLAGPTVIVRLVLTALVSPLAAAVSVYVPGLSILQPAKVATPETAALGFAVQVRVAPAGVVMVSVTEALLEVTVLPRPSWMATAGCVPKAIPPVELEGFVVKPSLVAVPAVMVKLVLTPLVSPLAAAVSV